MKKYKYASGEQKPNDDISFQIQTLEINIQRFKKFALIILIVDLILSLMDLATYFLNIDQRFNFSIYLKMYLLIICVNIGYLIWIYQIKNISEKSPRQIEAIQTAIVVYISFVMCWGSVISLIDQKLYGHLTSFMVNLIICSVIFYSKKTPLLISYIVSTAILLLGLPFFQKSSDVLVGHYTNISIFIVISWVVSRIFFSNYCNDYANKILLKKSKAMLEAETQKNIRVNARLKDINLQLKRLSLIDELTNIPNRRSLRSYIDYHLDLSQDKPSFFSVIMIDVDNFKQLNDKYGHNIGDKVLVWVAKQLNTCINSEKDFIARWGGDEFIFASFNKSREEVRLIADSIHTKVLSLNANAEVKNKKPHIGISLGTCTLETTQKDCVSKCIECADKALYAAKTAGRNCVKDVSDCYK